MVLICSMDGPSPLMGIWLLGVGIPSGVIVYLQLLLDSGIDCLIALLMNLMLRVILPDWSTVGPGSNTDFWGLDYG